MPAASPAPRGMLAHPGLQEPPRNMVVRQGRATWPPLGPGACVTTHPGSTLSSCQSGAGLPCDPHSPISQGRRLRLSSRGRAEWMPMLELASLCRVTCLPGVLLTQANPGLPHPDYLFAASELFLPQFSTGHMVSAPCTTSQILPPFQRLQELCRGPFHVS